MRGWIRKAALVSVLAWATSAGASEHRGAIMDLLNQLDGTPSAESWKALDDGVDAELIAIADDHEVPHSRRGRAVTALQFFPSDSVNIYLVKLLVEESSDALLRRKAAWSLAVGWGDKALSHLVGPLGSEDVQLRIATVHALESVGSPAAMTMLAGRLPTETTASVSDAIRTALAKKGGE
jgi:hypothetical protein